MALIMGIVNLTPDSFYDGGHYSNTNEVLDKINQLIRDGVDILDIGAESTKPGSRQISIQQEQDRLQPLLDRLSINIPLSIDTTKPQIAEMAIKRGARIINDVSGQPELMVGILQEHKHVDYVLMHTKGTPETMQSLTQYEDVLSEILEFFKTKIQVLTSQRIDSKRIIIDPGFGFAKNVEQNICLLKNIKIFKQMGCRLLAGVSRKSFLGKIANQADVNQRLPITMAAHYWLMQNGIDILRVHDVKETADVRNLVNLLA